MKLVPSTWAGEILVREDQFENDNGTAHEVLVRNVYLVHDLPWPAKTMLDIGAHIGCAVTAFRRRYRGIKVVCVEPDPENVQVLRENAGWYTGVQIFQGAVSYSKEPVYLHSCVKPGGVSTVAGFTGNKDALRGRGDAGYFHTLPTPVEHRTVEEILDSVGWDRVDILKMDCEGAELDILRGVDLKRVGVIVGEWHDTPKFLQLVKERFAGWTFNRWEERGTCGMFRLERR